jgi:hypothetical protein
MELWGRRAERIGSHAEVSAWDGPVASNWVTDTDALGSLGGTPHFTGEASVGGRAEFEARLHPWLAGSVVGAQRQDFFVNDLAPVAAALLSGGETSAMRALGLAHGSIGSAVAEGVAAIEARSVGAMAAEEAFLNWSPKSVPTWGHTFLTHGEGASVLQRLIRSSRWNRRPARAVAIKSGGS